jgi:signal transduction histidine kinase
MAADGPEWEHHYDLIPEAAAVPGEPEVAAAGVPVTPSVLRQNLFWFCNLRWGVVGALMALGVLAFFPTVMPRLGLRIQAHWPLAIAGILAVANVAFLAYGWRVRSSGSHRKAETDLWCQIALDLAVLTAVVHFVGSVETWIAFAYLFHIVLACIFFSPLKSFLVTVAACFFYTACVAAEIAALLPRRGIWPDDVVRRWMDETPGAIAIHVASAVATWLVVWYLASHLSGIVRERERSLEKINRRLVYVQHERARHMLHTTHELKAPFAAIHANVQLLLKGYCGTLPEPAREVAERISARCRRLAAEIQEMLQLANLAPEAGALPTPVDMDLAGVIRWCVSQVTSLANERQVVLETVLRPARVVAVEDHVKVLLGNLLTNAVRYSHPGGTVSVECRGGPDGTATATVADRGIGIAAAKLPRIFDEYYRTEEAVSHNRESSGLGLAIVRTVAERHGIRIRVSSTVDVGTMFEVRFPAAGEGASV